MRSSSYQLVRIASLSLHRFRNHIQCTLPDTSQASFVVLTGDNGTGKTNILEALSLFSPGRGLRRAKLSDMVTIDQAADNNTASWAVRATVHTADEATDLATGLASNHASRILKIDGNDAASQQQLATIIPMLWLTPKMDRLFIEGAAERRRFIDRLAYNHSPQHLATLRECERLHRQRNEILQHPYPDSRWLDILEQQLSVCTLQAIHTRVAFIEQLNQWCAQQASGFPAADIRFNAASLEILYQQHGAEHTREQYCAQLRRSRHHDIPAAGVHRSDWMAWHTGKAIAGHFCSTGEQKALLLSLLLAATALLRQHHDKTPVLLLDEIGAHLDATRRTDLFEELAARDIQAWLTGTHQNIFTPLPAPALHFSLPALKAA